MTKKTNRNTGSDIMMPPGLGGMGDKKYLWVTNFDDDALASFYDDFMRLENDHTVEVIPIFISSYGGQVDALTSMRDLMKSSPKPVATIAIGKAMSCGVALTAAGTKGFRFSSPNARFMIHEIAGMEWGKNSDVQVAAKEMAILNKTVMGNLAKDMGKSYEWLMNELQSRKNADWFLLPHAAKVAGIIDHISVPRINATHPQTLINVFASYNEQLEQKENSIKKGKSRK